VDLARCHANRGKSTADAKESSGHAKAKPEREFGHLNRHSWREMTAFAIAPSLGHERQSGAGNETAVTGSKHQRGALVEFA
jgi:hypothetical protein